MKEKGIIFLRLISSINNIDGKVYDDEGKGADDEPDAGIEDGVFGFFGFSSITAGGHVGDATNNNEDYGNNTKKADYDIDYVNDNVTKIATAKTTGRLFDIVRSRAAANIA